jgi:hypothetical protein
MIVNIGRRNITKIQIINNNRRAERGANFLNIIHI